MTDCNINVLINTLLTISRLLTNLKYDCCGREYILDEDEIGWIFFCRDLADETLRKFKGDDE